MVRFLPGLIAAIGAFVLIQLFSWALSIWAELGLFAIAYAVLAVLLDVALQRYARGR